MQQSPLVELVGLEQQRRFGLAKRDALPRYCLECEIRFACNGACPKDRFLLSPHGEPGLNALCAGYKAFFAHIERPMQLMAAELRAGRPAARIAQVLVREEAELQQRFARAHRNDPCPCGSGRKFKKCCGTHNHGKEPTP